MKGIQERIFAEGRSAGKKYHLPLFSVKSEKRLKFEIYFFCVVFIMTFLIAATRKYNLFNYWRVNIPVSGLESEDELFFRNLGGERYMKRASASGLQVLDDISLDGDAFDLIDIVIRSKVDVTHGTVYWKNAGDSDWGDAKSCRFHVGEVVRPIYHKHFSINAGEHDLWGGDIVALCFEFPEGDETTQLVRLASHRDIFLKLLNIKQKRVFIGILLGIYMLVFFFPSVLKVFRGKDSAFDTRGVRDEVFFTGIISLFAFVSFIPFDVYPGLRLWISSVPLTLPSLIVVFLAVLFIILMVFRGEFRAGLRLRGFELGFFLFLVASFISFKNAAFLKESKILMVHYLIPTFLLCFFVLRFMGRGSFLARLINWGIFFSTATAAYSLAEYAFNDNVLFDRFLITYNPFIATFSNYGPSYGTFIHPNVFGSYLLIFIPFSFFIFLNAPTLRWRMYGLICCLIQIFGLFASRSWGSFVSLIAVGIIVLYQINRKVFKALIILLLCIVIVTVAIHFKPYREYIERAKEIGLNAPPFHTPEFEIYNRKHWDEVYKPNYYSVYSRELMLKYIWRVLERYPLFGMGLNNFVPRFYEFTDVVGVYLEQGPIINNQYIMLLGETGLLGFICFLLMIFFLFRGLVLKFRALESDLEKLFIYFCGVSISGFLLNIIFYDGFYWWAPNFCFYLVAMSILAYTRSAQRGC